MAAFLYFVVGAEAPVTRDKLQAWGLDYAFEGVPYHHAGGGPGETRGVLLCDATRLEPHAPKYLPAEQAWRKVPRQAESGEPASARGELPEIHVGYYSEARPTRDDLAREEMVPGSLVTLADGQPWQVPLVRQVFVDGTSDSALPAYLDVDDQGQVIRGETVEKHRWLFELCAPFWEAWMTGFEQAINRVQALSPQSSDEEKQAAARFQIDCPTLLIDAVQLLGANYRLGLREAMMLGLWKTDDDPAAVLKAACNTELAGLVLEKKNLCDASST